MRLFFLNLCLMSSFSSFASIVVHDAVALLPAPGQSQTAVYFNLMNHTDKTITSFKASSGKAQAIELHDMKMQDGVIKMREIKSIQLEPHQSLKLAPGGKHLMVLGLKDVLKEGDKFPLTLCLSGQCVKVEADIVHPLSIEKASHNHHHAHH